MNWKTIAFWLLFLVALVYAFQAPEAQKFAEPVMAKLLFFHLPCAFTATWFIILSAWFGMRYLQTGEARFDVRNHASVVMGLWFASFTMGSGIVFSYYQWNAFWSNDPRQTSFLVVLLLCAAGASLRGGLSDDQKAAKACAVYSVATILPMLFLIFVLPRILSSLHPSDTLPQGKLDGAYWTGVLLGLSVIGWAARYFYLKIVHSRQSQVTDEAVVAPVRPVAVTKDGEGSR